jgi:hypothetical protein
MFASLAVSAIIPVLNPSFEDTNPLTVACGGVDCAYNAGPIPDWVTTGPTGSWQPGNPSNSVYFDGLPDGVVVAYANGGTITQIVSEVVTLGTTYTLLVDVGNRKDLPQTGEVYLTIGGTPVAAIGGIAAEGAFATFTATYTGLAADVGKSIGILLTTSGPQGVFDNVQLSSEAAPVPEPASVGLLGLGLLGIMAIRRRSAKQQR